MNENLRENETVTESTLETAIAGELSSSTNIDAAEDTHLQTPNPFEEVYIFDKYNTKKLCSSNSLGQTDVIPIELDEYISLLRLYFSCVHELPSEFYVQEFIADFIISRIKTYEKRTGFSFDETEFSIFGDLAYIDIPKLIEYKKKLDKDIQGTGLPSGNGYACDFIAQNKMVKYKDGDHFICMITEGSLKHIRRRAFNAYSLLMKTSSDKAKDIIAKLRKATKGITMNSFDNSLYVRETRLIVAELEYLLVFDEICEFYNDTYDQTVVKTSKVIEAEELTNVEIVALMTELIKQIVPGRLLNNIALRHVISAVSRFSEDTIEKSQKRYRSNDSKWGYSGLAKLNASKEKIYSLLSQFLPTDYCDENVEYKAKFQQLLLVMKKFEVGQCVSDKSEEEK